MRRYNHFSPAPGSVQQHMPYCYNRVLFLLPLHPGCPVKSSGTDIFHTFGYLYLSDPGDIPEYFCLNSPYAPGYPEDMPRSPIPHNPLFLLHKETTERTVKEMPYRPGNLLPKQVPIAGQFPRLCPIAHPLQCRTASQGILPQFHGTCPFQNVDFLQPSAIFQRVWEQNNIRAKHCCLQAVAAAKAISTHVPDAGK